MDKKSKLALPAYSTYFEDEAKVYRDVFSFLQDTCEDITALSEVDTAFGYDFLEKLLNTTDFSREFKVSTDLDMRLERQYFQQRNDEKLKGQKNLGIGYPILFAAQKEAVFSIPFFIWTVQLENIPKSHYWALNYTTKQPVRLNPFFTYFMKMRYGKDVEADLKERFVTGINAAKIAAFCNDLVAEFGLETNSQQVSLMPCSSLKNTDFTSKKASIQWSAVLGIFPAAPSVVEKEVLATYLAEKPLPFVGNAFGLGDLSPSQSTVIQGVKNNFITLVEGSTGTGKSTLLNYLAINGLSKGGKCLLVSDNIPALVDAQKSLAIQGLGALTFLFRDELSDENICLEWLKSQAKNKTAGKAIKESDYRVLVDRLQRKQQKMEAHFAATQQLVFGKHNWQETLGFFLEVAKKEPKELLNSHLVAQDFSFTEAELFEIVLAIKKAPALFKKVITLHHPLTNLNTEIFKQKTAEEAQLFISETQQEISQKAAELQHRFILIQNEYAEQLSTFYEDRFMALRQILVVIKDKIGEYSSQFGSELQKSGKGTLQFYGLFSSKFKAALQQREAIFDAYGQLKTTFAKQTSFEFHFDESKHTVETIHANILLFEEELQLWWKKQTEGLKDELGRLSHVTAHPALGYNDKLQAVEEALDTFLDEINATGLYQLPMDCTTLTLSRRQQFLEEKIGVLEQTAYHLRDFSHFYPWQSFWVNLSIISRKVIKALTLVNPNDWEAAFKSWYFHNALSLHYDPDLPTKDYDLDTYAKEMEQLQAQIIPTIKQVWRNRRQQKIEVLKDLIDDFSTESPTIKSLFRDKADLLSDYAPIILTTPKMAQYFAKTQKVFDYLLIDEAQTAFTENYAPLFSLAKRVVVFTNPVEENPQKPNLPQTLRTHLPHLPYSPLTAIENSQTKEGKRLIIHPLNARFSQTNFTNEEEARKVIHLLNGIKETAQRTFPSVGIACFTKAQRDLIISYLFRIKQQQSAGADLIQQLERNGLGVFCLDELRGQHFDMLIVSVTYGETSINNALTETIHHLNTPKGIAQIHLLTGRAKEKLTIIHSIPEKNKQAFLQKPKDEGTYRLATLIDKKRPIIAPELPLKSSVFIHQLNQLLQKENRVSTFSQAKNYLLEEGVDGKKIYLPDGCFAQTSNTNFVWEHKQRKHWTGKGYEIVPVWSVLAWKR